MANRRKRTPEQNRAIYERRKARAIEQGWKGYGQKRYQERRRRETASGDERKRNRVRDILRGHYPDPSKFDESGWLDRDKDDRDIKRILRSIERKHGARFDDVTVNQILFDETTRWANFRAEYERMMGWAM